MPRKAKSPTIPTKSKDFTMMEELKQQTPNKKADPGNLHSNLKHQSPKYSSKYSKPSCKITESTFKKPSTFPRR